MIAVEERQGAFARDLDFEQARVTSLFIEVVRIADDLARSGQPDQGAIPITYRAIDLHVAAQDACDHAVGVALAERQCSLLERNRDMAFDQFIDQIQRQFQTVEARPKDRKSLFMLTTCIRSHFCPFLPFTMLASVFGRRWRYLFQSTSPSCGVVKISFLIFAVDNF